MAAPRDKLMVLLTTIAVGDRRPEKFRRTEKSANVKLTPDGHVDDQRAVKKDRG